MKKYISLILMCIISGFIMGKIMFRQYDTKEVSTTIEPVYFFQAGVYEKEENMNKASTKFESYISIKKDNKYYVVIAITKSHENMEKLKGYFKELGYDIYVKEKTINNTGFLANLDQYDILLKEADSISAINAVNKSVLATYEEMMNSGNN